MKLTTYNVVGERRQVRLGIEENFMNKFFRQLDETYWLKCSQWEKAGVLERLGIEENFMNKFFRQLD